MFDVQLYEDKNFERMMGSFKLPFYPHKGEQIYYKSDAYEVKKARLYFDYRMDYPGRFDTVVALHVVPVEFDVE